MHKKESRQVYRKILWLVIGLLAPELVVWNAWKQRSQTKALTDAMRDMGFASPRENQELCHNRVHPWTDVHSWYVIMGGLAFEDNAVEELQFMPGTRQRMTLTD